MFNLFYLMLLYRCSGKVIFPSNEFEIDTTVSVIIVNFSFNKKNLNDACVSKFSYACPLP